ncbi:MAG TPA: PepSY-like domain-containing protein [Candidatus Mucispirillum faecigallinarum]|uniref:PepSY-like domain-containing protein n=1 Tax=Candidatus Mucispirillum faecigallinarum TaxID=2838699 RepID=A0A9D2GUM2_9BACT|nr:PepSY-like domain-containing protein [Candidatus Mucispirillum faecigallinarum]
MIYEKTSFNNFISLFAIYAFAEDIVIKSSQLPGKAQNYIKDTFKNINVTLAEKYRHNYKVILSNGITIKFNLSGEWEEIKSHQILPKGLLPLPVEKAVILQNLGEIVKIEKDLGYYEVILNNGFEIKVDNNGNILKIKQD